MSDNLPVSLSKFSKFSFSESNFCCFKVEKTDSLKNSDDSKLCEMILNVLDKCIDAPPHAKHLISELESTNASQYLIYHPFFWSCETTQEFMEHIDELTSFDEIVHRLSVGKTLSNSKLCFLENKGFDEVFQYFLELKVCFNFSSIQIFESNFFSCFSKGKKFRFKGIF